MEICRTTEILLNAKEEKKLSFAGIGKGIGRSEIWVSALFYGQAQATAAEAGKIVAKLGLGRNR